MWQQKSFKKSKGSRSKPSKWRRLITTSTGWCYLVAVGAPSRWGDWWLSICHLLPKWGCLWLQFSIKKKNRFHPPASSKWPFDSPNGGPFSPEKVTYSRSKRCDFEEAGRCLGSISVAVRGIETAFWVCKQGIQIDHCIVTAQRCAGFGKLAALGHETVPAMKIVPNDDLASRERGILEMPCPSDFPREVWQVWKYR